MARKGSAEYKEARKQARRETFVSGSVFPKLVEADRAHNRLWEARNRGARTTQARREVRERVADYNEAFDAGVARRMGEDKPKAARKGRKTAHVPAGNANGGQFTGVSNPPRKGRKMTKAQAAEALGYTPPPKRARKPKASAPKRNLLAEEDNRRIERVMARPHAPTSPHAKRARNRQYAEYHAEIEADLAHEMSNLDDYARDGSWTPQEISKARAQARRNATRAHKEVPGWEPPAKPAPKPRKSSTTVPRQGRRTRRNTQQRGEVYSEARRGLNNRRARGA